MSNLKQKATEARKTVLTMIHRAGTSHIASNFSCIDIATVLYDGLGEYDEVVWSAGWKAATIYYFLQQQGKIPKEDLEKFPNPPYLGLAEPSVNGVHVAGGSMGHGLPVAVGMALAKKKLGREGIVYCIMSDGEHQEGTTWEAAQVASHNKLDNLVVFVDYNKWCAMGRTNEVCNLEPLENRWRGFGWLVSRFDGHDFAKLDIAMDISRGNSWTFAPLPLVFICDTIKGKGVSFMQDNLLYHYRSVNDNDYEKAMSELCASRS